MFLSPGIVRVLLGFSKSLLPLAGSKIEALRVELLVVLVVKSFTSGRALLILK